MSDQDTFKAGTRLLALALIRSCEKHGANDDETVAYISAALGEAICQKLGIGNAIDHLRNMADIIERQALQSGRVN